MLRSLPPPFPHSRTRTNDSCAAAHKHSIKSVNVATKIVNQVVDTIVPMKYDNIDDNAFILDGHHYFMVELNGKYGALKENGQEEVPVVHPSEEYVKYILKIQSTIIKGDGKQINYDN